MRSVRKAEKSLSGSPQKRNAVASSLAKKFHLRILPQHLQSNRGRTKQDLDADEKSWLIDFLDRQGIMYTTPGKRHQVYMGKINGEKVYETKKYLLWTLNDLLDILNGCEVTGFQTEDSFMNELGRKLSFRIKIHLQQKHFSCRRVTREEKGGRSPLPFFENLEKCPNLRKNCPDCGHLWVKFFI